MKNIWRWIRIIYGILFIFSVVGMISVLGFIIFGVLKDQQALINTATINSITLIMAGVSLPGILVQLVSLLEINQKKSYTATTICPKCRHHVDLKMTED